MINPQAAFQFHIDPETCHQQYCEIQWRVPSDSPYFAGHFPGQPMLPAIAVIDANTVLLQKFLAQPIDIKKVVSAKFSAPILPQMEIKIRLEKKLSETGETWDFQWQELTTDQSLKPLAHMTLLLDLSKASAAKL